MNSILVLVGVVAILTVVVAAIIKSFYGLFVGARNTYYPSSMVRFKLPMVRVAPRIRKVLARHFNYYQNLSAHDKYIFEKRVAYFIKEKQFVPRNMDHLTEEMIILISASAIQISFGFSTIFFANFHTILIYPDSYYSNIYKQYHQGEVNQRGGIIILSWSKGTSIRQMGVTWGCMKWAML